MSRTTPFTRFLPGFLLVVFGTEKRGHALF